MPQCWVADIRSLRDVACMRLSRQGICKQLVLPYLARTFNSDGLHPGRLGRIMMRISELPQDLAEPPMMLCSRPVGCLKASSLQPLDCSVQLRPSLLDRPSQVSRFGIAGLHGKHSNSSDGSSLMPIEKPNISSPLDHHGTWNKHRCLYAAFQEAYRGTWRHEGTQMADSRPASIAIQLAALPYGWRSVTGASR